MKYELDCDFCNEFAEPGGTSDRIIAFLRDEFLVLATVGCFSEGYCLYMPISHERSFAVLGEHQLMKIETELEYIRQTIADEYDSNVILAEHGVGSQDKGAACCDHAHIHLIPVADPRHVFMLFYSCGGDPQALESLSGLSRYHDSAYIYLSCAPTQHLVWKNANAFGRQFVRRVCAGLAGCGAQFNWRAYPFYENMHKTAQTLRKRFRNQAEAF